MNNVINSLIDAQHDNIANSNDQRLTLQGCKDHGSKVVNSHIHVNDMPNKRPHNHLHKDINYPSKIKCYIAIQPTDFEFIGLDGPGIDTKNIHQYLNVAKTIKESGVPIYKQVSVPIKSGLIIETWKHYLHGYEDQVLV